MVIYISLLSIITLKKKKHYCMHKARMMNLIYIYIYIKEELKELYIILPSSHKEDFSTIT